MDCSQSETVDWNYILVIRGNLFAFWVQNIKSEYKIGHDFRV
jgi:hypothetical protein